MATASSRRFDVERINIIEADGTLPMTLSNKARSADPTFAGTPLDRSGQREAGLLFFNDLGDECGGPAFGGSAREDATAGLLFDRFGGDQTIGIDYAEGPKGYGASFFVRERRPELLTPCVDWRSQIMRRRDGN